MNRMSDTIITVKGLVKRYGKQVTVDGLDFEVKNGAIFGILGPNGAGKTTTLEMIEALRAIDAGVVEVDGIDVAKHPHKAKQFLGIQLQTTSMFAKLTLREQINLYPGS